MHALLKSFLQQLFVTAYNQKYGPQFTLDVDKIQLVNET
jgi:hypothetical protein